MAGIYIHIPFCRRKCHYCNFFSLASRKHLQSFPAALISESELTKDYLGNAGIETVYFGGGTPSIFDPGTLQQILDRILGLHPLKPGSGAPELTLELNPEDADDTYISRLRKTAFNRFSLGVQSFHDHELRSLNRHHTAGQSVAAVKRLQDAGYTNISIDLIYGIPGVSDSAWNDDLGKAIALDVPHISAYALTVEQNTPLAWMISRRRMHPVAETDQARQFGILMETLTAHGFEHYEISNFARPGLHARHNTNYWRGIPYLGLGPSAHSYNGTSRRWNISNLTRYIDQLTNDNLQFDEELLTPENIYNEYVMTGLRTMWGCSMERLTNHPLRPEPIVRQWAEKFRKEGMMVEKDGTLLLTGKGKYYADAIASAFFIV